MIYLEVYMYAMNTNFFFTFFLSIGIKAFISALLCQIVLPWCLVFLKRDKIMTII